MLAFWKWLKAIVIITSAAAAMVFWIFVAGFQRRPR
jgi:hypothetical protein